VRADAIKGHLDGMLLAVLDGGPRHGYAVIQALRDDSGGRVDLPAGTVYPALHRLERAGLIDSHPSVVSGRRRRTYALTDAGRASLRAERDRWAEFAETMTAVMRGRTCPAAT
jgi:DNA-binding PadR family transcriptional regulator